MQFSFLGHLRINGQPVRLGGRWQLLLTMLALHPGAPQPRRHLAHLLWPESTHQQALGNLRKALHDLVRLRPDLETYLKVTKETVCLGGSLTVDLVAFSKSAASDDPRDLEAAVALYEGDLLTGYDHPWLEAERERLRLLYREALGRLVHACEGVRQYERACHYAELALRVDPYHEELHRALMRLHASQGDLPAAIHTYQRLASLLQDELGVDPAPATREAYRLLLERDQAAPGPSPHHVLIGRQPEWARLMEAWRQIVWGTAQLVLLTGAPGIGKTRLAMELRAWAERQGVATAVASCYATEGSLPFRPVAVWLRSLELGSLPVAQCEELARLLPELGAPATPLDSAIPEPFQQVRWFDCIARALLGRQPLLLLIDDLQWCDPDSLHLLAYLLRREPGAKVMVVGTVRLDELAASHPLLALRTELRRVERLTEIALGPLDAAESVALAHAACERTLDGATLDRLVRETGGNPLFLLETIRAGNLDGRPPESVQAVVGARLAQLPPVARQLAEIAAIYGRAFTPDLLQAVSGLDGTAVVDGLEPLWSRGLITGSGPYAFAHQQLRQVVLAGLSPLRRQQLHRLVAEALLRRHADDPESIAASMGAHLEQAGAYTEAARQYLIAGAAARGASAHETAIQHYRQAMALLPKTEWGEPLLQLGELWLATGRPTQAAGALQEAVQILQATGESHLTARAIAALGVAARRGGRYEEAATHLRTAADLHIALGNHRDVSRTLADLANTFGHLGDLESLLGAIAERVQWAAPGLDPRGDCIAQVSLCHTYFQTGDMEQARVHYDRLLRMGQTLRDPQIQGMGHSGLGYVALMLGDHAEALVQWQAWLDCATSKGDQLAMANAIGCLGTILCEQGDTAAGFPALLHLARTGAEAGDPRSLFLGGCLLAGLLPGVGRTAEGLALCEALLPLVRSLHAQYSLLLALQTYLRLLVDAGRLQDAEAVVTEALALATQHRNQQAEAEIRLLAARLRAKSGQWNQGTFARELERLLDLPVLPPQRVEIYADLAAVRERDHREGAVLMAVQYRCGPKWWYRVRYQALMGDELPAPPRLSVLPEWLPQNGLPPEAVQELISLCAVPPRPPLNYVETDNQTNRPAAKGRTTE